MYRNSPVRNPQRAKGIKVKNVLQVCLLVAVCFWLIFQVKRSHDKRKEFDASDNNKVSLSLVTSSGEEIAKMGRKDLQPKLEKTGNVGQEEEDDHDDDKREDEEQDEDKIEEEKDDEIDENEEKPDVEIEREEVDVVGEEKDTEENEDVSDEKYGQTQIENEVSSEEHTHEAREENYKADDASSAVTHTGRTLGTENEIKNGSILALNENVGQSQTAENGTLTSPNTTLIQENDSEPLISDVTPASLTDSSENGPPSDTTLVTSQSTETKNISNSEVTESDESSSDPLKTELETETESNNETEGTEETIDPDEAQRDAIDSTDLTHLEEKDVRNDLDTLPDIETEGGNNEDTAAE